ncbi:bactofilin family protein [Limibacillus halophilus]|jgi:cytoskeletal protein CcmA (bactofilin family)
MFKPTKTEDLGDTKPANAPSSTASSGAPSGSGQDAQRRPAASSGSRSVLGSDLKIVGNLISKGDLNIEGEVEGDVNAASVTIGRGAKLNGSVKAERVEVLGDIKGQVDAASVNFAATAHMEGDVLHDSLSMEAGAYINGHVRRRG